MGGRIWRRVCSLHGPGRGHRDGSSKGPQLSQRLQVRDWDGGWLVARGPSSQPPSPLSNSPLKAAAALAGLAHKHL